MTSLIEIHYLPGIAWFSLALKGESILLEKHEHFVKQSYRSRCYINTEHGRDCLSIPLKGRHGKVAISDIRVDHSQKWLNHHWRSIQSAYGKAPFFEHYADDLRVILGRGHEFLYDLNYELLTLCLQWLRANVRVEETTAYNKSYSNDVWDFRGRLSDKEKPATEDLFRPVPYIQVFGNSFVEDLSIIDLVFCCGPEAGRIVRALSRENEQIRN